VKLIVILFFYFFINNLYCYEFDEEKFLMQYFWREVISLSPTERPKIGLVLSGGGARGLAHIGVIKVLEEEGIPIDIISGNSVGALIGALYSSGLSVDIIEKMAQEIGWNDLTNISPGSVIGLVLADKLLSTQKMENYISQKIGNKQFYELKIPFGCVATDLITGEKIIFTEGNVSLAARASACIPGVFLPVEYRHRLLVDGGCIDNIPNDIAKLLGADIIITVVVESDYSKNSLSNVLSVLTQVISIQQKILSQQQLKLSDIIITPKLDDVSIYELWKSKKCIEEGIIATRKLIPEIKKTIMNKTYQWLLKQK